MVPRIASLRGKTLAIVVAATLALVGLVSLPLRSMMLARFEAIEHAIGERDLDRTRNTLADHIAAVGAMARDYSVWDETYAFADGEAPQYVAVNFADTTFAQNRIGLAMIRDRSGRPLWSQAFDLHTEEWASAPAHVELFRSDTDVLVAQGDDAVESVAGLARTESALWIVGAHAILTSTAVGPSRGTMLLGRPLDGPEIARLAEQLRLDIAIVPLEGPHEASDIAGALATLGDIGRTLVRPIDEHTLAGYALLRDVRGEPTALLRVTTPRTVYAQGREDADSMAVSVAIACLLFGLLVLLLLERAVVRRIAQLGREVGAVGAAADHSLRVGAGGGDEIGTLAGDVNRMLASLERLNRELDVERAKAERLLRNILPGPIADRLKDRQEIIADAFPEVSVLFGDLVGFTTLSSRVSATELVVMLNDIFSRFDALAERHGLEKIKTIGDAYMIVAGLPEPRADHAQALTAMGLDMQEALAEFNAANGAELELRIGINTGPVVAGVIGTKKFIYDLWGDAVNIASRMESSGVPGRVQISESTRALLGESFELEARGSIQVKGKGEMRTWLVVRRAALAA